MGTGVPLLNDYKKEFVWKRLPQTLLGGAKFRLGYTAPPYVYINQVILLVTPSILGGAFTVIVEVALLRFDIGCYVYGALMLLFSLVTQIASVCATKRRGTVGSSPDHSTNSTNKAHNILSEDDVVEFDSCCGPRTVAFVSPVKPLWLIPVHALFAGLLCGAALWFLLPSVIRTLYASTGAAVVLDVLGWLTVAIGVYSLTVTSPPELAQFRALVTYDVMPVRPVSMAICIVLHIIASSVSQDYFTAAQTVNRTVHVVFVVLPVLWLSGIVPPAEALGLWAVEQLHVHIMGGSPMATTLRTIVVASLSILTLLIYFARESVLAVLITLAACGYLLSTDLCGLAQRIARTCRTPPTRQRSFTPIRALPCRCGGLWLHVLCLAAVCGTTAAVAIYASSVAPFLLQIGYTLVSLWIVDRFLCSSQKVYVIFSLIRNPLYPCNVNNAAKFRARKKYLMAVGVIRRILINVVVPALMQVYVVTVLSTSYYGPGGPGGLGSPSGPAGNTPVHFWRMMQTARILRWIWQSTNHCFLDVSIYVIVTSTSVSNPDWLNLGPAVQLFIITLARDRSQDFVRKFYAFAVIFINSWREKKQRHRWTIPTMVLTVFLFPLVFCVLGAATCLSAPLLPVFTLPIFWMAFPRPTRFWPGPVKMRATTASADAVFYQQAAPALSELMRSAINRGVLDCQAGFQYLLRYQDRIVWATVLERGHAYCTVNIKGLELQETSCHTIEATRLDDAFALTFEQNRVAGHRVNPHFFDTLTPRDAALINTYSDAKNVLTGIIDAPDNLELVWKDFKRTLTWLLIKHVLGTGQRAALAGKTKIANDESMKIQRKVMPSDAVPLTTVTGFRLAPIRQAQNVSVIRADTQDTRTITATPKPSTFSAPSPENSPQVTSAAALVSTSKLKSRTAADVDIEDLLDDWDDDDNDAVLSVAKPMPSVGKPVIGNTWRPVSSPAPSEAESIWSTDSDHATLQHVQPRANIMAGTSDRLVEVAVHADQSFGPKKDGFSFNFSPAADVGSRDPRFKDEIHKFGVNIGLETKFRSLEALNYKLPNSWLDLPVGRAKLTTLTKSFPVDWLKFTLHRLATDASVPERSVQELVGDDVYCHVIAQVVAACHWIVYEAADSLSTSAASLGPGHLYKCYQGAIPLSTAVDWLNSNPDLSRLVITAYRYAVKVMIDQAVMGEVADMQEMADYLSDYDDNWFIGSADHADWSDHILKGTRNLMSLSHSVHKGVYNSRTLTKQDVIVYVGTINSELTRAQWANLSLELLYMTNDDEERFSIQAHPAILRNLTVQAADPPFGYPVFSSDLISITTL